MVSRWEKFVENLFSSPKRTKLSLFYFAGATLFLGFYFFLEASLFNLVMSSGFLLTGIAEFLPKEKGVLSGVLRITAIIVYMVFLVLSFLRPEVLFWLV